MTMNDKTKQKLEGCKFFKTLKKLGFTKVDDNHYTLDCSVYHIRLDVEINDKEIIYKTSKYEDEGTSWVENKDTISTVCDTTYMHLYIKNIFWGMVSYFLRQDFWHSIPKRINEETKDAE